MSSDTMPGMRREEAARILVDARACEARPVILENNLVCPLEVDCRWLLSSPEARGRLADALAGSLAGAGRKIEIIAGAGSGGIAWADLVSRRTGPPPSPGQP